jgi:hypothetical protein
MGMGPRGSRVLNTWLVRSAEEPRREAIGLITSDNKAPNVSEIIV